MYWLLLCPFSIPQRFDDFTPAENLLNFIQNQQDSLSAFCGCTLPMRANPFGSRRQRLIGALPLGCNVITVNADGTGDYPTIQEAIDASLDGFIIELADGVYVGDGNRNINFGGRAVTLRSQSGDPYACVINCQGSESSTERALYLNSGETSNTVIEGIRFKNG